MSEQPSKGSGWRAPGPLMPRRVPTELKMAEGWRRRQLESCPSSMRPRPRPIELLGLLLTDVGMLRHYCEERFIYLPATYGYNSVF